MTANQDEIYFESDDNLGEILKTTSAVGGLSGIAVGFFEAATDMQPNVYSGLCFPILSIAAGIGVSDKKSGSLKDYVAGGAAAPISYYIGYGIGRIAGSLLG